MFGDEIGGKSGGSRLVGNGIYVFLQTCNGEMKSEVLVCVLGVVYLHYFPSYLFTGCMKRRSIKLPVLVIWSLPRCG